MLSIDLRNATIGAADNFTCLLFQLMLKADPANLVRLSVAFPIEARMIRLFKAGRFPKDKRGDPDYDAIERDAKDTGGMLPLDAVETAAESLVAASDTGELPLCAGYVLGLSQTTHRDFDAHDRELLKRTGEILYYTLYVTTAAR